jgi:hypothetical protein
VAAQAAIDDAAKKAKELLKSTAGGFETDAKTKQDAYEIARKDLEDRIASGDLSPEMKAQILAAYDDQQGMSPDFKKFLTDPNRMGLASSLGKDITDYGGTVGDLESFNDKNLAKGFKLADTPTDVTSFMSDDQYNPYSRINSLLGKDTTRAAAAKAQPLTYDATNLSNAQNQFNKIVQDANTVKTNFKAQDKEIGTEFNNIDAIIKNELRSAGDRKISWDDRRNSGNYKRAINSLFIKYFGTDGSGGIAKSMNWPKNKIDELRKKYSLPEKPYSEKEINDSYIQTTDDYIKDIEKNRKKPTPMIRNPFPTPKVPKDPEKEVASWFGY